MLRILDHIHVVDRIFQQHLKGLPHTFSGAAIREKIPELQVAPRGRYEKKWTTGMCRTWVV